MNLDDIPRRFSNHFGANASVYALGSAATSDDIVGAEKRIGFTLPEDVAQFFFRFNGLTINDPHVDIWSIGRWHATDSSHIQFATVDKTIPLLFNVTFTNTAGQWDILGPDMEFRITLSFASLCTVHLWKWIDRRIPFWQTDWLDYAQSRKTYNGG